MTVLAHRFAAGADQCETRENQSINKQQAKKIMVSLSDRADNLALHRKTDGPKPYFVQKLST